MHASPSASTNANCSEQRRSVSPAFSPSKMTEAPRAAHSSVGAELTPSQVDGFVSELEAQLPLLRARALKLCLSSSDAQDLTQDTIERALRFRASYRPGTNFRAWVQQVQYSLFISRCRRRQRERRSLHLLSTQPDLISQASSSVAFQSLSPRVQRAIAALPEKFANVIRLVDLEELTYREAAAELCVPVGTVMSRLFRGRRQLADALRDNYIGCTESVSVLARAA